MEKRGEVSELCEHNRQVRERNKLLALLKAEKEKIERAVARLKDKIQEHIELRRQERAEQKTGYAVVDDLLKRATERAEQQNRGQEHDRGKGRGKDDNTLTH